MLVAEKLQIGLLVRLVVVLNAGVVAQGLELEQGFELLLVILLDGRAWLVAVALDCLSVGPVEHDLVQVGLLLAARRFGLQRGRLRLR